MFDSIIVKAFVWITILGGLMFFVVIKEIQDVERKQENYYNERLSLDQAEIDFHGGGSDEVQEEGDDDLQSIAEYIQEYRDLDITHKTRVDLILPDYPNDGNTLKLLRFLAGKSGLRDIGAQTNPSYSPGEEGVREIGFTVNARGDYNNLLVFLKHLEHSLRIFHITKVATSLSRAVESSPEDPTNQEELTNQEDLSIEVSGKTYYYSSPVTSST